jgi:hypothetical protein
MSNVPAMIEQSEIGSLFGGDDEIFAITSDGGHAYTAQTEIWFLPERGRPKKLLSVPGVYEEFTSASAGKLAGVVVARQTYDGIHAETKGETNEFYAWNRENESLTLQQGH